MSPGFRDIENILLCFWRYFAELELNSSFLRNTHQDDRNVGVFLLELFDVRRQLQSFLVVTIPHASIHKLRHLEYLQQLRVTLQGQVVHSPTKRERVLCLLNFVGRSRQQKRQVLVCLDFTDHKFQHCKNVWLPKTKKENCCHLWLMSCARLRKVLHSAVKCGNFSSISPTCFSMIWNCNKRKTQQLNVSVVAICHTQHGWQIATHWEWDEAILATQVHQWKREPSHNIRDVQLNWHKGTEQTPQYKLADVHLERFP